MTNKQQLIHNLIILLSISFVLIGCGSAVTPADDEKEPENSHYLNAPDNLREIKSENRYPLIEIWKELDGSVSIRGKSLYFRMYDDETVEFDYESRKETESGTPRYTYSIERVPLTKISDEEFRRFKSLSEDLTESKDIKKEYEPVAATLDTSAKLTILLKENATTERKIIINDSDLDILDKSVGNKFPNLLVDLIKKIHSIRVKLRETSEMER